jgi:hypothetical protein
MAIWYISWPFGIIYGRLVCLHSGHLVYFPRFGILNEEKSGNPGWQSAREKCHVIEFPATDSHDEVFVLTTL